MLNYNLFLEDSSQLSALQSLPVREVILEHAELSRQGILSTAELCRLLKLCRTAGIAPLLQWDILATEPVFEQSIAVLQELPLSEFTAIRVQDLGAAEWLRKTHPTLPMHLIVETGNHNFRALKRWTEYFGPQLERLVLSNEIPREALQSCCEQLKIPCEILGLGPILLFYSPRALLSRLGFDPSENPIKRYACEGQSFVRHFPTFENKHGTLMFHDRDLFLLDLIPDLLQCGLHTLRLDLRTVDFPEWIEKLKPHLQSHGDKVENSSLKEQWPVKTTHGFYRANRTDRPIERLKNKHLRNHEPQLVGTVAESIKGEYMALISRKRFHCNQELIFVTPEGRKVESTIHFIRNTQGQSQTVADPPGVWLIPHVKYVTTQTLVYQKPQDLLASESMGKSE
ncbi:U32 family peptidase [Deltaproteobacteria bacterium TL4]